MAVNGTNPYNTTMRMWGLGSSGLDPDSLVTQMMRIERMPLDRLYQKKQVSEWKRDSYREITSLLNGFQNDFFNSLKPSTNMRFQSVYQKYNVSSTNSAAVTVTGGSGVSSLSHTITVTQLATASNATSTGTVSESMVGGTITDLNINDYNNSFILNVNGTKKTITIPNGTYADANAIVGNGSDGLLKQLVKDAFSNVNVEVDASGGIKFSSSIATDSINVSSNLVSDDLLSVLGVDRNGAGTEIGAGSFPLTIEQGRKFTVSIVEGGVTTTKEIEWAATQTYNGSADVASLAADIQSMIDSAFGGAGKITVNGDEGKLTFTKGAGVDSFSLSNSSSNNKVVEGLGFTSGYSNKLSLSDTMEKASGKLIAGGLNFSNTDEKGDYFTLKINGESINVYKTDSLSTFINKVNTSNAGVTLSYSSFTDTFNITSKETGEGTITLDSNGSNFFEAAKLTNVQAGKNSEFVLDGEAGYRASNTFTIDGVSYTLLKGSEDVPETSTITLSRDVDAVYDSIKSFIDKYNEVISTINSKLKEEYDRDYLPLTDEQKEAMNEDDIKRWETKAKTGLLRNDELLNKITGDMRKALFDPIDGISDNLTSIGITTGFYDERGKLVIDEAKLKEAISNNPDMVMNIFSKESETRYSANLSAEDRRTRYNENGIISRIYDVLQDNIRTSRDSNNNKGALLQKAGLIGDISEFANTLYDEINDYTSKIDELVRKLDDRENRYYSRFVALEKAITQMSSQSSWMMSQFGGG